MSFKKYRRNGITEMRPYVPGEDTVGIAISEDARNSGSPKEGDWIARDTTNHGDQWLVTAEFYAKNDFVEVPE